MRATASIQATDSRTMHHAVRQRIGDGPHHAAPFHPYREVPVYRKTSCACGGECPACQAKSSDLKISQPNDPAEIEADQIADRVMRMPVEDEMSLARGWDSRNTIHRKCNTCEDEGETIQRKPIPSRGSIPSQTPAHVQSAIGSGGTPLDYQTRNFFEPRLGYDLTSVRIHAGGRAAESAHTINAKAYTLGHNIVFGRGEYRPESGDGRYLLAHELAHVTQQSNEGRPAADTVQRTPTISVQDANDPTATRPDQRRAAASTPIGCCNAPLGTLHAMPLFTVSGGVGESVHFIASGTQPASGERCHCDDYHIIQVVDTSHPPAGRTANSYVDNNMRNTPFYMAAGFLGRHGEHVVPRQFPDAGERLGSTESIYDAPTRGTAGRNTDIHWRAETCVACEKNNEADLVLGCVKYGFDRTYDAARSMYLPVSPVNPSSLMHPSTHFVDTLRNDSTTSTYDFELAPSRLICENAGDYPMPGEPPYQDDGTRVA